MRYGAVFLFSVLVSTAACGSGVAADELTVLAVPEMAAAFQQVIPDFVRSSNHSVVVEYGSSQAIRDRLLHGEKADVVFATETEWPALLKDNKVENPTAIASFGLGLGVQPGRLVPDTKDLLALKNVLQTAKTIGVVSRQAGPEGARLSEILQRHVSLKNFAPKIKVYVSWVALAAALSQGDVEIGLAPTLNLAEAGLDFTDKLPPEVQKKEVVSAALAIDLSREDAARAFVRFFRRSDAKEALRTTGLDPARATNDWSAPQSAAQQNGSGK